MEKVVMNVERYGNTSAATIPIALSEALDEGRAKPGDTLAFVGFGAGLTWASCLFDLGPMVADHQLDGDREVIQGRPPTPKSVIGDGGIVEGLIA
jgi:3-oxoacyl-[acyl-carrier-protein] synthase-3